MLLHTHPRATCLNQMCTSQPVLGKCVALSLIVPVGECPKGGVGTFFIRLDQSGTKSLNHLIVYTSSSPHEQINLSGGRKFMDRMDNVGWMEYPPQHRCICFYLKCS